MARTFPRFLLMLLTIASHLNIAFGKWKISVLNDKARPFNMSAFDPLLADKGGVILGKSSENPGKAKQFLQCLSENEEKEEFPLKACGKSSTSLPAAPGSNGNPVPRNNLVECGYRYTATENAGTLRYRIPTYETFCEVIFEAGADVLLNFRCNRFRIRKCEKEAFGVVSDMGEQIYCGRNGPSPLKQQSYIHLIYARVSRRKGRSKIQCKVTARRRY